MLKRRVETVRTEVREEIAQLNERVESLVETVQTLQAEVGRLTEAKKRKGKAAIPNDLSVSDIRSYTGSAKKTLIQFFYCFDRFRDTTSGHAHLIIFT